MIAKADAIGHGANAMRYSVNKDKSDLVKVNLLPEDITAEAMSQRMFLTAKLFAANFRSGRKLKNNVIRIEVSPSEQETENWTLDDWRKLTDEFIRTFDSLDLSNITGRKSSKRTNLQGSQYTAALHRDSKSGILHLHIIANRVDMKGEINDGHMIGMRAVMAANIINERRGWVQSMDISKQHKDAIASCCMDILRNMNKFSWNRYVAEIKNQGYGVKVQRGNDGNIYGYSVQMGNSSYKSSELGIGRKLTPSNIEKTWEKLHSQERKSQPTNQVVAETRTPVQKAESMTRQPAPAMRQYDIAIDKNHKFHVDIPEAADNIIRKECSTEDASPFATMEDIQRTALLLFAGYLDAATSMSSSGGGGGSPQTGWGRDPKEDDIDWARRCALMANGLWKRRRGIHR